MSRTLPDFSVLRFPFSKYEETLRLKFKDLMANERNNDVMAKISILRSRMDFRCVGRFLKQHSSDLGVVESKMSIVLRSVEIFSSMLVLDWNGDYEVNHIDVLRSSMVGE